MYFEYQQPIKTYVHILQSKRNCPFHDQQIVNMQNHSLSTLFGADETTHSLSFTGTHTHTSTIFETFTAVNCPDGGWSGTMWPTAACPYESKLMSDSCMMLISAKCKVSLAVVTLTKVHICPYIPPSIFTKVTSSCWWLVFSTVDNSKASLQPFKECESYKLSNCNSYSLLLFHFQFSTVTCSNNINLSTHMFSCPLSFLLHQFSVEIQFTAAYLKGLGHFRQALVDAHSKGYLEFNVLCSVK